MIKFFRRSEHNFASAKSNIQWRPHENEDGSDTNRIQKY